MEPDLLAGVSSLDDDGPATDLDHDQRLSIVAGINYQPQNWFTNLVAIYGSGLTNEMQSRLEQDCSILIKRRTRLHHGFSI